MTTLTYDCEDRVTGITYPSSATNSFTYNGLDTRVGKVDSTGTYTYKRDGAGVTNPVLSDGSIAYTPGASERVSGSSTFDHGNYLGSFTRQTNSLQTTTSTRVYDAFGNLESTTGTPSSPFGFAGKQGYQEDSNSRLKLLGHRHYDPTVGRFITRDDMKSGTNWFTYCDNNPLRKVDPSGFMGTWGWGGLILGTIVCAGLMTAGAPILVVISAGAIISGVSIALDGGNATSILANGVIGGITGPFPSLHAAILISLALDTGTLGSGTYPSIPVGPSGSGPGTGGSGSGGGAGGSGTLPGPNLPPELPTVPSQPINVPPHNIVVIPSWPTDTQINNLLGQLGL